MSKPLILVTGATGKTGRAVVEELIERGFPVRALARKRDGRSRRLEALGAEVVLGDFHDLDSIRRALKGSRRAYFCAAPQETHLVEATALFAIAAREEGVEAVVNMSQVTAREGAPSRLSRQHWAAERVLDRAGVGAIHVKPTFFAENLFMLGAQTIASGGKLYLPYGDERHAPIATTDIARIVAILLADPSEHAGESYVLTGPEALTIDEMAERLSAGLGTAVEYVDLPPEAWGEALAGAPDMTESLNAHLQAVGGDHRNGVFNVVTDEVERIGGRPPLSLDRVIQDVKAEYGFEEVTSNG